MTSAHWPVAKLETLVATTSGGTPSRAVAGFYNGHIPWVKSGELNDGIVRSSEEMITEAGIANSSAKVFPNGTLLIAMYGATVGKLGVLHMDAATNQAICALFPGERIQRDYLFYYLLQQRQQLIKRSTGGAQPNISQDILRDLNVPVPPAATQRRIAAILDKANRLRRLRRYALELSDTYLQSVFLEMFGDPLRNEKGWDVITLADLNTKFFYGTSQKSHSEPRGIPVLRIPNVLHGEITLDDLKYGELPEKETKALSLKWGDLLFVRTNGNPDFVGRCAVFDLAGQYAFASYLICGRLDLSQVHPLFALSFLRSAAGRKAMWPYIRTTAGQSNIGIDGLGQIPIPLPPFKLQEKFAQIVKRDKLLRIQQREALRQAEHLFQALLHQAFEEEE